MSKYPVPVRGFLWGYHAHRATEASGPPHRFHAFPSDEPKPASDVRLQLRLKTVCGITTGKKWWGRGVLFHGGDYCHKCIRRVTQITIREKARKLREKERKRPKTAWLRVLRGIPI